MIFQTAYGLPIQRQNTSISVELPIELSWGGWFSKSLYFFQGPLTFHSFICCRLELFFEI